MSNWQSLEREAVGVEMQETVAEMTYEAATFEQLKEKVRSRGHTAMRGIAKPLARKASATSDGM